MLNQRYEYEALIIASWFIIGLCLTQLSYALQGDIDLRIHILQM